MKTRAVISHTRGQTLHACDHTTTPTTAAAAAATAAADDDENETARPEGLLAACVVVGWFGYEVVWIRVGFSFRMFACSTMCDVAQWPTAPP
jgi:hypothetical protein